MPIFDFKCSDCGTVTEFLITGENKSSACPQCGGKNLEKLISAPSLLRKTNTAPGKTCCGREERCETPACATGRECRRF